MTAAARKPRHTSTRYITGETFKCFDLDCNIDHDLQSRDFPMFVDGQIIGYAHNATEARTTIHAHCEELARQTRADTADAEAERAAETVETLRERLDANTDAAMRYPLGSTERVAAQAECCKIMARIDALRAGEAHIQPQSTPEQQAARDAENEANMLDFIQSSNPAPYNPQSLRDQADSLRIRLWSAYQRELMADRKLRLFRLHERAVERAERRRWTCPACGQFHHIQQCAKVWQQLRAGAFDPKWMHMRWREQRGSFVLWLRLLRREEFERAACAFAAHLTSTTGVTLDAQSVANIWRVELGQPMTPVAA